LAAVNAEASHVGSCGSGVTVVGEVDSLQAGSEQVLAGEAGVEVQPHSVAQGGRRFVVFKADTISKGVASQKDYFSFQLGGGGELIGFEFCGAGF
jgi:hypothetical protein